MLSLLIAPSLGADGTLGGIHEWNARAALHREHSQLSTNNCTSNLDCSLNGECTNEGRCRCDAPWRGESCGTIGYNATTPAVAKDIWPIADTAHNTWGGPIAGPDSNEKFHAFIPLYRNGSLWGAKNAKHGVATALSGPFSWSTLPDVKTGINPSFLSFRNASGSYYTIWDESFGVSIARSLDGPFRKVEGFALPRKQPNPAPIYHENAFFLVTQHTQSVWTTPALVSGAVWTLHGNISQGNLPTNVHVEVRVTLRVLRYYISFRCSVILTSLSPPPLPGPLHVD